MNPQAIFWPVLAHIAIIYVVFILLGIRKSRALAAGGVDARETALDNDAWPDDVRKVSNNIRNQFQLPVLFYVLCLMFHALDAVTPTVTGLAWLFVASRAVHAYVHVTTNYVPARFGVFTLGLLALLVMTLLAAAALV